MSRASTLPVLPSATHSYDTNDRLTSDTYDPNGNTLAALLRDPVNGLPRYVADQYDFEDQLLFRQTTINGQPTEVLLAYDGDGNRVKKTVTTGSTSASYFYVVDDRNPTGYAQVVEELQPVSSNPVQLAVYRAYTYGLQLVSQDQLIGSQWVASYYGYDGYGSVRFLTDATGTVTDTYDYDAFGNLIARSGNTPNVYLYRGEQYDAELGLYYLRARYANPETGRFWTADTFEGFADDPHSLHKYTFNHNDPVNRIDPSGHFSLTELSAVSVIGAMSAVVVDNLAYGTRHFVDGLTGSAKVRAVTQAESRFIDSITAGPGLAIGRDNFYATQKGAPFLLNWNPLCKCDPCVFSDYFFLDFAAVISPTQRRRYEEQSALGAFFSGVNRDLIGIGARALGGMLEMAKVGHDIIGQTAANAGGDGAGYQGISQLYQSIAADPQQHHNLQETILTGTVEAAATVGTLGIYAMGKAFGEALATGDYRAAQDASLGALFLSTQVRGMQTRGINPLDVPTFRGALARAANWFKGKDTGNAVRRAADDPSWGMDVLDDGIEARRAPVKALDQKPQVMSSPNEHALIGENTLQKSSGCARNANGGVDFANSPELYPGGPGQKNVVKIKYTGSRKQDFGAANKASGVGTTQKPPKGYTWHHLDDYDPKTNTGTMQLVGRDAHEATYPHTGGVSQYEKATGAKYK